MQTKRNRAGLIIGQLAVALLITALPALAGDKSETIKAQEAEIQALRHRLAELESGKTNVLPPAPLLPLPPGNIQDEACDETMVLPAPNQPEPNAPAGKAPPPRRPIAIARAADGGAMAVIVGPGWEDIQVEDVPPPKKGERPVRSVQPPRVAKQEIGRNKGTINNTTINVIDSPGAQVTTASGKVAKSRSVSFPVKGQRRPHVTAGGRQIQGGCFTAGQLVVPSTYVVGRSLPGGLQRVAPYREHDFNEKMKSLAMQQTYEKAVQNYYTGRDVYTGEYPEEYYEGEW